MASQSGLILIPIALALLVSCSSPTVPEPASRQEPPPTGTEPSPTATATPTPAPDGPQRLSLAGEDTLLPEGALAGRMSRGAANDFALSPDGRVFAVSSEAGLALYDYGSFDTVWFTPLKWETSDLYWSPDGEALVTRGGCTGCTLAVWDALTGEQTRGLRLDLDEAELVDVAVSAGGEFVAALIRQGALGVSRVDVLRVEDAGPLVTVELEGEAADSLRWRAGGESVVVLGAEGWEPVEVEIPSGEVSRAVDTQNLQEDACTRAIPASVGELSEDFFAGVVKVCTSPIDGSLLLGLDAGLGEPLPRLVVGAYDPAGGSAFRPLEYHRPAVSSLAWSPDGTRISWPEDNGAVVVDVPSGCEVFAVAGHSARVLSVGWSGDGALLATGDQTGEIRIWDATTGELIHAFSTGSPVYALYWSPDGARLAAAGSPAGAMYADQPLGDFSLWDARSGEMTFTIPSHTPPAAWSSDGRWLLVATPDDPRGMAMIDADSGESIPLSGGSEWARATYHPRWTGALAPDDSAYIHAFIEPGTLGANNFEIISLETGEALVSTEAQFATVSIWGWSSDGATLAMAGPDRVLTWDAAAGRLTNRWEVAIGSGTALAWSPDSRLLATASSQGTILIWDTAAD